MLNGKVTVSNVDYESCVRCVFPKIMEKVRSMESSRMSVRFLNGMGEDLLLVVLKILGNMSQEEKDALVAAIVEVYNRQVRNVLELLLDRLELKDAVRIGRISAGKAEGEEGLSLMADGVEIDYSALMKTGIVSRYMDLYADRLVARFGIRGVGFLKGAAKAALAAAFKAAPGEMEKKGVGLFAKPDINDRVKGILGGILEKRGLNMTIDELVLVQEQAGSVSETGEQAAETEGRTYLPESVKGSLVDAAVKYLKDAQRCC